MARGEHLRGACGVAHLVVEAARAGVAYRGTDDELCGSRSSGACGDAVAVAVAMCD